jgi:hypothetical protein
MTSALYDVVRHFNAERARWADVVAQAHIKID